MSALAFDWVDREAKFSEAAWSAGFIRPATREFDVWGEQKQKVSGVPPGIAEFQLGFSVERLLTSLTTNRLHPSTTQLLPSGKGDLFEGQCTKIRTFPRFRSSTRGYPWGSSSGMEHAVLEVSP